MKTLVTILLLTVSAAAQAAPRRVLLPVIALAAPGRLGSVWQTDLAAFNAANTRTRILFSRACVSVCTGGESLLEAGRTFNLSALPDRDGGPGVLLYLLDDDAQVAFNLRVRDLSQQASSFGTELPVVQEGQTFGKPFDLLSVPLVERFRHMLRVYDITGAAGVAHVQYYSEQTGRLVREFDVNLAPARLSSQLLDGTTIPLFPAYGSVIDPVLPGDLSNGDTLRIHLTPTSSSQRLWAFATVTNNDTQELTTITPQ